MSTEEPVEISVRTGDLGVFRFEGIAVGRYVLLLAPAQEKRPAKADDDLSKAMEGILGGLAKKMTHELLVKGADGHPDLVVVEGSPSPPARMR